MCEYIILRCTSMRYFLIFLKPKSKPLRSKSKIWNYYILYFTHIYFRVNSAYRKQFFLWKLEVMFWGEWFLLVLLDGFLLGFSKYCLFEVEKLVLFFIFGHIVRLFMLSHANRVFLGLRQRWMYFRLCSVSSEIFACFFMVIQAHAEPMAMTELTQNDLKLRQSQRLLKISLFWADEEHIFSIGWVNTRDIFRFALVIHGEKKG